MFCRTWLLNHNISSCIFTYVLKIHEQNMKVGPTEIVQVYPYIWQDTTRTVSLTLLFGNMGFKKTVLCLFFHMFHNSIGRIMEMLSVNMFTNFLVMNKMTGSDALANFSPNIWCLMISVKIFCQLLAVWANSSWIFLHRKL